MGFFYALRRLPVGERQNAAKKRNSFINSPLEGCPKDGVDVFFDKHSIPMGL